MSSQRLADLLHEAQQPRLATEANVEPDMKTRKRTEDAVADRAKQGDNNSSARVDHDPMRLTSFGDDSTEPPALPCRDDALVDQGAEAPKPCLSPGEMRMTTTAGGLLPAGTVSSAMRAIFSPPPPTRTLSDKNKKRTRRTTLTSLSLSLGVKSNTQNQCKLCCLILAVIQVVYAPARFWKGGARCFVGGFSFGCYDGIQC